MSTAKRRVIRCTRKGQKSHFLGHFFAFYISEKRFFGPRFAHQKNGSQIAFPLGVLALAGRSGPVADLCFSSTSDKASHRICNYSIVRSYSIPKILLPKIKLSYQ